jgi:hypothetical protein
MQRVEAGSTDLSIFAFSHMFLVCTGNASKLLFSGARPGSTANQRAERLRNTLSVPEDSLLNLRGARNYLEHFDERLDRYLADVDGVLLHRRIAAGRSETIQVDDGRVFPASYLLFFDTSTRELEYFDQRVAFEPLHNELVETRDKAKAWLQSA